MPRGAISDPPASPGLILDFRTGAYFKFWPRAGETYRQYQIVSFDYPLRPGQPGYNPNDTAHRYGTGFARNVR